MTLEELLDRARELPISALSAEVFVGDACDELLDLRCERGRVELLTDHECSDEND